MNLNKKIPAAIALASCLLLPSCDFNEDFCTRYGELIAYCDWENITEKAPLPPLRHVIPFQGNASIQEAKTFTQDTLRWQLPRGDYRFVFYTGDYQVNRLDDYYECNLSVPTDTVNGKAYITAVQKYCCSSAFNEKLEYQESKTHKITPWNFVSKVNLKLNVTGNVQPLSRIS